MSIDGAVVLVLVVRVEGKMGRELLRVLGLGLRMEDKMVFWELILLLLLLLLLLGMGPEEEVDLVPYKHRLMG